MGLPARREAPRAVPRVHRAGSTPGDRLVLYSDGLIEALNDDGEPFGFERFEGVILSRGAKGADVLKQALLDSVKSFTRNRPPEDDQTLVVVSFEDRQVVALRAS